MICRIDSFVSWFDHRRGIDLSPFIWSGNYTPRERTYTQNDIIIDICEYTVHARFLCKATGFNPRNSHAYASKPSELSLGCTFFDMPYNYFIHYCNVYSLEFGLSPGFLCRKLRREYLGALFDNLVYYFDSVDYITDYDTFHLFDENINKIFARIQI